MLRESNTASCLDRRPRVGVIGGGQLAQMMVQAAIPLGIDLRIFARNRDEGAALAACDVVIGDWCDQSALAEFSDSCDAVTFDHELVSAEVVAALEVDGVTLRPSAAAMSVASDKATQRGLADRVGLRTVEAVVVTSEAAMRAAVNELGFPAVVKAVRGGYDGRGVAWITGPVDLDLACEHAPPSMSNPMLVEPVLAIASELAAIVARGADGVSVSYPVVQTQQVDGICVAVMAPAATTPQLAEQARDGAVAVADALDYVGVMAVEYFVIGDELFFNEMAPRPHNSGHYTIDACITSQFENHLRAVLGWPLGDPEMKTSAAVMANIIATSTDPIELVHMDLPPGARVHLYSKGGRSGRKVGHVTVCGSDQAVLKRTAMSAVEQLTGHRTDTSALVSGRLDS